MEKGIFALMDEDKILYTIGVYKNHVFREYPDDFNPHPPEEGDRKIIQIYTIPLHLIIIISQFFHIYYPPKTPFISLSASFCTKFKCESPCK